MMNRRDFFCLTAGTSVAAPFAAWAQSQGLVKSIKKQVLRGYGAPGGTWFHPRCCLVPRKEKPLVLMTLQGISGSDFFGPVHWTTTSDEGTTWSDFTPADPLGWVKLEDGTNEAVCDVTPEYHAKTDGVIALGHNVFYKTTHFDRNQPSRWPIYAIWKDGKWGPRRKLAWDDPRASYIYTNNCGQRVNLPNGDVMMSFTFGVKDKPRSVCGVLCSFDGEELKIKQTGPALNNPAGRGLLEPSLTRFQDRFYLTIRAEDKRGYVAVSDDGLNYEPQKAWAWDDGTPLEMSTTQQHWLTHSEALFLVYTRKDVSNTGVMRWRAPLWMAQVDTKKLCLIKSTEQIALPLIGDGVNGGDKVAFFGNFGVANVSKNESWITDGSWCPKDGNKGELALVRVVWDQPNALI
ncbi:MAG: hypothetical protein JNJ83_15660 [Verrucomicrobiaceae bacterium]|nr:hypothetical protein [Verrucomicrobiaceae bacterium]